MKDCVNCTQKKWVQLENDRAQVVMRCPVKNKDITAVDSVNTAENCNSFTEEQK